MRKSTILIWITLGYASGILIGSLCTIEKSWVYELTAFFIVLFTFSLSIRNAQSLNSNLLPGTRLHYIGSYIILAAICTCMGVWRVYGVLEVKNEFTQSIDEKVELEGTIVSDIDMRTDKQLLTVLPDGGTQYVLITMSKTATYFYGDRVWVRGKMVAPQSFDDFDYAGYLARYNVFALMRYPKTVVLKSQQGNRFIYQLLRLKYFLSRRATHYLREPESSLLLGILIGARKTLPQDVVDDFNNTGTSHIVAVSGFNITIIVVSLAQYVSRLFGRRWSIWICSIFLFAFVIMAGPSASVVRAMCMGILLLVATHVGRVYAITPAICFAALIMLIINPRILLWDAGFQLSFAATIGIVYGVPVLEKLFKRVPLPALIKSPLVTTLAAIITTVPLILLLFSRLSIVAPVVNVLVLPFIPCVMLFGFFSLLPYVGAGFAFIAHLLLTYVLLVVTWFGNLPFASVDIKISTHIFITLCVSVVSLYIVAWHVIRKWSIGAENSDEL